MVCVVGNLHTNNKMHGINKNVNVFNLLSLLKNGNNAMEIGESLPHKISTKLWNCLNELGLYYITIWFKVRTVWQLNCGSVIWDKNKMSKFMGSVVQPMYVT